MVFGAVLAVMPADPPKDVIAAVQLAGVLSPVAVVGLAGAAGFAERAAFIFVESVAFIGKLFTYCTIT